MKQFTAFLKKEILGEIRSGRVLLLVILSVLFGIMNPAVTKLTPWMLELLSDQLAESGMFVGDVTVDAMTSWTQFFKNMPVMLVIFLVLYGSILTSEYQKNTLILIVTKGMRRWKILYAKALLMMGMWTIGYVISTGITYGYNAWFWENPDGSGILLAAGAFWLLGIWLITGLCIGSVCSSSASSVLLITGAGFVICYVLSLIPAVKEVLPTQLLNGAPLLAGTASIWEYAAAATVTVLFSIVNLTAAVLIWNRRAL